MELSIFPIGMEFIYLFRDVFMKLLTEKKRANKVSDEITNNADLLEKLATKLDKDSKVLKNWYDLGRKLGVKKDILEEIKNGNSPNAVEALFDYIYTAINLTVEVFKEKMDSIDRQDVKKLLADIQTG
jgi:hypothetical protein